MLYFSPGCRRGDAADGVALLNGEDVGRDLGHDPEEIGAVAGVFADVVGHQADAARGRRGGLGGRGLERRA